jgi:Na+/melibiose symporter-like transporter
VRSPDSLTGGGCCWWWLLLVAGWVNEWFAAKDRLLERLNNFLQDQDDHSSASLITPSSPRQQPPEQQQQQQQQQQQALSLSNRVVYHMCMLCVVSLVVSCVFCGAFFSAAVCLSETHSQVGCAATTLQPTATAQAAVVSNFDTAFQDGSVFFHMVKKHRPDLLPSEPASMTTVWRHAHSPPPSPPGFSVVRRGRAG